MRAHLALLAATITVSALAGCAADDLVDGSEAELAPCPGPHTMAGIDVSVWQGHIDWHAVAAHKSFAIARAAYGTSVDSTFAYNYRHMRSEGMIRGSYQFFVPTQGGAAQADVLLDQIGTLGPGDLPPMLDVESDSHAFPSKAITRDRILAWKHRIEARTGRHPLIYTGAYFFPSHVTSTTEFREMGLVIPAWGPTCPTIMSPWRDWTMHQTTSSGHVSGISGRVDLDVFKGDRHALEALAGIHHCTPHCSGTTMIADDCTETACGGSELCSTAGDVAPHCESTICVASVHEVPAAHTTCVDERHLAHCDRTGDMTRTTCEAGTICVDDGTAAHCEAPGTTDGGVPAGDGGYTALSPYPYTGVPGGPPLRRSTITGGCSVGRGSSEGGWLSAALATAATVTVSRRRRR